MSLSIQTLSAVTRRSAAGCGSGAVRIAVPAASSSTNPADPGGPAAQTVPSAASIAVAASATDDSSASGSGEPVGGRLAGSDGSSWGVVVMPGSGFGAGGEGFFRISFITSPERIAEAARRAGRVLASMEVEVG